MILKPLKFPKIYRKNKVLFPMQVLVFPDSNNSQKIKSRNLIIKIVYA